MLKAISCDVTPTESLIWRVGHVLVVFFIFLLLIGNCKGAVTVLMYVTLHLDDVKYESRGTCPLACYAFSIAFVEGTAVVWIGHSAGTGRTLDVRVSNTDRWCWIYNFSTLSNVSWPIADL